MSIHFVPEKLKLEENFMLKISLTKPQDCSILILKKSFELESHGVIQHSHMDLKLYLSMVKTIKVTTNGVMFQIKHFTGEEHLNILKNRTV